MLSAAAEINTDYEMVREYYMMIATMNSKRGAMKKKIAAFAVALCLSWGLCATDSLASPAQMEPPTLLCVGGVCGFIGKDGNWRIEPRFEAASFFDGNGLAWVQVDGKTGRIDVTGNWNITPRFDSVDDIADSSLFLVFQDGKYGFINPKGEIVVPLRYDYISRRYSNGLANAKQNDKWGFVDENGKWIIPPQFDDAGHFASNGLAPAKRGGKWGYIDIGGEFVIAPQFDRAHEFLGSDLASVKQGNKWGFVNDKGKFVIPPRFEDASWFYNGSDLAAVELNGKTGWINKAGEFVIPPRYDVFEVTGLPGLLAEVGGFGKADYVDRNGNNRLRVGSEQKELAGVSWGLKHGKRTLFNEKGEVIAYLDLVCDVEVARNAVGEQIWPLQSFDPVMEVFSSPIFASQAEQAAMDGLRSFLHSDTSGLEPLCRQKPDEIRSELSYFQKSTKTALSNADLYYGEPGTEKELLLLDWKNRYLEHISNGGSFSFTVRAAAYRIASTNSYLFLSDTAYESSGPEFYEGIRLSKNIRDVFPAEFLQMKGFLPPGYKLPATEQAAFYLAVAPARHGTETVVNVNPIKLGAHVPHLDFLQFTLGDSLNRENDAQTDLTESEANLGYAKANLPYLLKRFFYPEPEKSYKLDPTTLPPTKLLALLLNGNIKAIGRKDRQVLEEAFGVPLAYLSDRVRFYHTVYQIERDMVADTLVLSWDRNLGSFVVKETKRSRPKPSSFREFLNTVRVVWI